MIFTISGRKIKRFGNMKQIFNHTKNSLFFFHDLTEKGNKQLNHTEKSFNNCKMT